MSSSWLGSWWGGLFTVVVVGDVFLLSCAKIGRFTDEAFQETFIGALAVIPDDDAEVVRYHSHMITAVGDGKAITFYGLTGPLSSLGLKREGSVSSVVGIPIDESRVEVVRFAAQDAESRNNNATVSGIILLDRKARILRTDAEYPIMIYLEHEVAGGAAIPERVFTITFSGRQVPRVEGL